MSQHHRSRVAIHRNDQLHKTHTYDTVASVPDTIAQIVTEMQTLGDRYVVTIEPFDADDEAPRRGVIIPLHSIGAIDVYEVPLDASRGPA